MKLILIFLVSLAGFSYGNEIGFSLERLLVRYVNCGVPGVNTPTKCVSKTQFIYNHEDINDAKPLSCPAGTVCADVPGACAAGIEADCTNENFIGEDCSSCKVGAKLTCISPTAYTACSSGKPVIALARECAAPFRYCEIDESGNDAFTCVAEADKADCKASTALPITSPLPPIGCAAAGLFPVLTDTTCKSYYSCALGSGGVLQRSDYTCPTLYIFNRNTKRCVSANTYTCPR